MIAFPIKPKLVERINNEIEKKYNRLTVISFAYSHPVMGFFYNCKCECGNTKIFGITAIKRGSTKSCGCLQKEALKKLNTGNSNRLFKHGDSHTKLHICWVNMIDRCTNKNCTGYKNYGGRGITICKEWIKDYLTFKEWAVSNGFCKELTLDRINVNGNYEPSNCRWITQQEQCNNRRATTFLEMDGITMPLADWSRKLNIKIITIHGRLRRGLSVKDALTLPVKVSNRWKNYPSI